MIRDITIGQFFPGESLLHRADPRMKIILSILYIVVIFMTNSLSGYIFLVLFTAALAIISRISFTVLLKAVKPLWFIILFTAVINIFWNKDGTLLVSFWKIEIYSAGLWNALFMMLRIVSLLIGTSVILTYTTSPIALTDAIERLLDNPELCRSIGEAAKAEFDSELCYDKFYARLTATYRSLF